MTTNFDDVGDFHTKFELESVSADGPYPREVPRELLKFRIKFMFEELVEFLQAVGAYVEMDGDGSPVGVGFILDENDPAYTIDHEKAFDSLIDKVYIDMGTAHLFGYPWQHGWDLVQAANMSKVRSTNTDSTSDRGSSFDVVKPPGWVAPNIAGLLQELGFEE